MSINWRMIVRIHEIANMFPMMGDDDYRGLVEDIRKNGLREPIYTKDGAIIDGRNRYKACQEIGTIPLTREYPNDDLVTFVVSLNLSRRHLTSSQKATVAVEALPLLEAEAKKRQIRKPVDNSVSQKIEQQNQNKSTQQAAQIFGTNRQYVSAAKKLKAESPEAFEKVKSGEVTLSEVKGQHVHVAQNSGNNEWYTPKEIVESARLVMGAIHLDPASSSIANESVMADRFFTKEEDGLKHEWSGCVWLNPPYAQPAISHFSEKLCESLGDVTQACVLVNNATETGWFQSMARKSSAICFPRQRIKFLDPEGNLGAPLQGQAILYLGQWKDSFKAEFSRYGFVMISNEF